MFVDYTANLSIWDDPICGVTAAISNDTEPTLNII